MKKNVTLLMESSHSAGNKKWTANRWIRVALALCTSFGARVWASDSASEAEVRKAQDSFAHCWTTRDDDCMARLLTPDFTWVFRTGKEVDRDAFLATIRDGTDISRTFVGSNDAVIHFYGPVALLTFSHLTNAPNTFLTLVWFNSNSYGWQLVRGQGTWKATTRETFTPPPVPELVGNLAPEFALKDVDGREITLASLRGKPVLLDFWATWCKPCQEATPHIQALHDQYKDMSLMVLGIDTNEPAETAKKYFAEQKYTFANLLGSGTDVIRNYGANGIPLIVLIDKDGVVRYVHQGWGAGIDLTPQVKRLIER